MIDWNEIDTVLLDMDGTLLDLYFDNFFWQEYLPEKWGELYGIDAAAAKQQLHPQFRSIEGTLSWYCLDHWSEQLQMDMISLKTEIEHLIQLRPEAEAFLKFVSSTEKDVVMVTNAHQDLIEMKFNSTGIGVYFNQVYCSHQFGSPKEETLFWERLQEHFPFVPGKALLIDDNLSVLRSAQRYGIGHLLTIAQPDSSMPAREIDEFKMIESFRQLF